MTLPTLLRSSRLTLPLWSLADATDIASGRRRSEWHPDFPRDDDRAAASMVRADDAWGPRSIVRDGVVVGSIGCFGPPELAAEGHPETEVGFGLVEAARGDGAATEALVALLAATDALGVALRARVDVDNAPSLRVLAKAGFTRARDDGATSVWRRRARVAAELPVLQGQRLLLRPTTAADVDALYALHSDPLVMRYWSFPAWTERAQAEQKLQTIREQVAGGAHAWAIADAESDELIGMLALFAILPGQRRAEIGYSLRSGWHGRGLATEAMHLALHYAFTVLGLERIEADIDPRNEPSCKLVERLGFVREGLLRARWRVNGEVCDSALYGLLRSELVPLAT